MQIFVFILSFMLLSVCVYQFMYSVHSLQNSMLKEHFVYTFLANRNNSIEFRGHYNC